MPNVIGQNALVLGPLVLMALIGVLWYAFTQVPERSVGDQNPRLKALGEQRDQLLNHMAALDHRHESQALERREYVRQREQAKRQLRRIALLLARKQ